MCAAQRDVWAAINADDTEGAGPPPSFPSLFFPFSGFGYVHRSSLSFNFDLSQRDIVAFRLHSQAAAHHSLNCSRAHFQAPTSYKKKAAPARMAE